MVALLELWDAYSAPAGTIIGAIGGVYGTLLRGRMSSRRDRLDAGRQALELVARASDREARIDSLVTTYMDRLDAAQRQRIDDMGRLQDVYAAAIAARLVVYELDASAGRPPRDFAPLPPYPFPQPDPVVPDNASADETGGARDAGPKSGS